jgi:hypothetical protein
VTHDQGGAATVPVDIEAYRRATLAAETAFRLSLAGGRAAADSVALRRLTWDIMRTELTTAPHSVLAWDRMPPQPPHGRTGAAAWAAAAERKADEQLNPEYGSVEQLADKHVEYLRLADQLPKLGRVRQERITDRQRGREYLILGADPLVAKALGVVAAELRSWAARQPNSAEFVDRPARAGLARMLSERPDLVALIRIAERLPLDAEISDVPVQRPGYVEVVEFALGVIPVLGNAIAVYEVWAAEDLFGYRLTEVERGVLAASVLLPAAGRLVKAGRAIYTEARLVSMYGRDAAAWSRVVGASGRALADRSALATVAEAERLLRTRRRLTGSIVREAAGAVPRLARGGGRAATAADPAVAEVFRELNQRYPVLGTIDVYSIERVLAKGPNVDHLKGQLLEELVESRIVPWLGSRQGGPALGIAVPAGKKLEFIPGHLVRDAAGRQISDGLLAYRDGERLVIAAVFEAKAGRHAARELSVHRATVSSLTPAERAELRANAKDVWREQRDQASASGLPYTKTLTDVEREYALSELGGQVRRDIERLTDARIRIGATETFTVTISPTRTKFFGVLPRDVPAATIEKELSASGFMYEIIGADIRARDLAAAGEALRPLAEKLAELPP